MEYFRKSLLVLNKKQKFNFFLISFLNFFITFLELLGISIIFPVISILVDPSFIYKYSDYKILSFVENYNHNQLIIISLTLLIFFYFIKTIMITLATYVRSKRMFGLSASLSEEMFSGYVNQPLSFLVPKNSAYVTRNIIDFPEAFVSHVLFGIFTVLSELVFIIGTFLIFIKLNFTIGLSIAVLTVIFIFLFNYFNFKNLSEYGKSLNDKYAQRIKTAREAIEGIKEISLYKKQDFFNKIYSTYNYKIVGLSAFFEIRQNLPKFLLEFLAVLFISASIFFFLSNGYSPNEIFPIISVFAAGMIKAIPSTSKLLSSMQRIKASEHVVDTIFSEITKFKK